jgi:glucose-1-phosphate cytidylyltransferase
VCGGYKIEAIISYFENFAKKDSNFQVNYDGEGKVSAKIINNPNQNAILPILTTHWNLQIVNTGQDATTAGRIKNVKQFITPDYFHCTYGDGLSSVNLSQVERSHLNSGLLGTLTAVHPPSRFGEVEIEEAKNISYVKSFREKQLSKSYINGGFFVFNTKVIDMINPDESLEEGLLTTLSETQQLNAFLHNGFWQNMDTVREMNILNEISKSKDIPWLRAP